MLIEGHATSATHILVQTILLCNMYVVLSYTLPISLLLYYVFMMFIIIMIHSFVYHPYKSCI